MRNDSKIHRNSIFRSWKSYYFEDTLNAPQVYSDDELARLRRGGHNGIFLQDMLREISYADIFPEMKKYYNERKVEALNILVERAKKHGIDVFLYLVEPRCLNETDPFWQKYPQIKGTCADSAMVEYERGCALCTSEPAVLNFLENATAVLFRNVAGLKGLNVVTASEHLHHCLSFATPAFPDLYGTQYKDLCPKCRDRDPAAFISEIINAVAGGAFRVKLDAEIVASSWNWSWYERSPQKRLISLLDKRISIETAFDLKGIKDEEVGNKININEYSLSCIGPSENCIKHSEFLKEQHRRFYVRLVLGTTHELASVPCLPVPTRVYEKVVAAQKMDVAGYMGWTFGNVPCVNLRVFEKINSLAKPPEDKDLFMRDLALEIFPGCDPATVYKAWRFFSMAIDLYPFSNRFLYYGPVNYALAYKQYPGNVRGKPMNQTWLRLPRDGDDLSFCCNDYREEIIIERFDEMSARFKKGLSYYRKGLKNVVWEAKREELCNAEIIPLIFASVANIFKIHLLKKDWKPVKMKSFRRIMDSELRICRQALPLVIMDKRLGFHPEAQSYMFSEELIQEKIDHIRSVCAGGSDIQPGGITMRENVDNS